MNSLLFGSLHPDEFNNLFKPLPDDNLTARTGCFERERERESGRAHGQVNTE